MTERIIRPAGLWAAETSDPAGALAVRALLQVDAAGDEDAPGRFAHDLLICLGEVTGAAAGRIEVDRADGRGAVPLASFGPAMELASQTLIFPVAVSRPWTGQIQLATSASLWGRVLGELAAERFGLALENERLREADLRRQTWLTFLAEASELLAQSLDIKLTMALVPRLVVPRLGQWCAVYLADGPDELALTAAAHTDEALLPELLALLEAAYSGALSDRWQDVLRSSSLTVMAAPMDGFLIPLIARGQRLGTLAIGRHPGELRDPDEIAIAEDVARRAALALDNARVHEERRKVAQTLQQALLPPTLPKIPTMGLGAEYVPAADGIDVGGDFYDVTQFPDGRYLLLIGDVSGKGVQAATVTGLVRDVIRVLVRDGKDLPAVFATLNDTLFERRERHCTIALAVLDEADAAGRVRVTTYLAGHDHPVLVRADGTVSTEGSWGTALGLLPRVTCPEAIVILEPGDALIFFTDGVTDRRRGDDFFGLERLKATAERLADLPAEAMAARLRAAALEFSNEPQRDDMAIMVLRNDYGDLLRTQ
ncbi:hypothetical protein Rhe02_96010 [Rhizocola hellebori]|uniref:PPM-type phosphatase domain-containing protein n=1 Tax=Rhizocola hellebori TaxID=1392758 RepID=A0A8J3QI46_9ACTN|nr:GAF domain-containing SpoIIE family protein phosphatase [Rhizocola hellebori]GIH11534.1 hypothetical protein Rhe02_96010 [Rhizocola hellebori]